MPDEQQKLNPRVRTFEIGIRDPRTINVYPLSVRDQLSLTEEITKAIESNLDQGDIALVAFVIGFIRNNVSRVLSLVTGENEEECDKMLGEMDNNHVYDLAELVYSMNYESPLKNVKSLFERVRGVLPSERPPQPSASDTDTPSETSLAYPSRKVG